jgi:integrase
MPPALSALQIGAVTDREVTRALIALNKSGQAESSVKRFRASLSAFFAWAVRERLIVANPVTGTRVPKGRGVRAEIRPFAEDELESFYMAASARDQRLADVLLIASWTGLRWSELREVRVRDFVRVPPPVLLVSRAAPEGVEAKVTKSGRSRRVPVADRLLPLVQACAAGKGPDDLLFTTRTGHQLHASAVKRSVAWSTVSRPTHPRPAAHRGVPVAGQGSGPGDGPGVAGARVNRHDEHLPAPPRLVGGPGRTGASQRAGGRGGVRIRRGTSNDNERTPPLRWCFRWWDGVSVWWS